MRESTSPNKGTELSESSILGKVELRLNWNESEFSQAHSKAGLNKMVSFRSVLQSGPREAVKLWLLCPESFYLKLLTWAANRAVSQSQGDLDPPDKKNISFLLMQFQIAKFLRSVILVDDISPWVGKQQSLTQRCRVLSPYSYTRKYCFFFLFPLQWTLSISALPAC